MPDGPTAPADGYRNVPGDVTGGRWPLVGAMLSGLDASACCTVPL